jgi:choline kinase
MEIVILAAGTGSRLMPLTRNTPKSLLDLGNGYSLLESQLHAIHACGVRKVTLVTGYRSEQIEAKIHHYKDFKFRIVFNPFYRLANNLVSAWMGLKDREGEIVLINGDDVFKAGVLQRLMDHPGDMAMVVSRKPAYDADDMKVLTRGDRVLDVGKDLPPEEANGESIGMFLLRDLGLRTLQGTLDAMVRSEDSLQLFYLAAFRRLMKEGHAIHPVDCLPKEWSEVDFHPDLDLVKERLKVDLEGLW